MPEDLDARIGCNLRAIRLKAGLGVDALADRAKLQATAVLRYEEGAQRIPVEVLARLAAVLDQPLGDFFA